MSTLRLAGRLALPALAACVFLAGCSLIREPTVRMITDRAEMAAYVDRFNALQSDVRIELSWTEAPFQSVLVGARADLVVNRVRCIEGNVLVFSSGHFLRVLAARWLGLEPAAGKYFLLRTASLSALSYEHNRCQPVIRLWDDTRHVGDVL